MKRLLLFSFFLFFLFSCFENKEESVVLFFENKNENKEEKENQQNSDVLFFENENDNKEEKNLINYIEEEFSDEYSFVLYPLIFFDYNSEFVFYVDLNSDLLLTEEQRREIKKLYLILINERGLFMVEDDLYLNDKIRNLNIVFKIKYMLYDNEIKLYYGNSTFKKNIEDLFEQELSDLQENLNLEYEMYEQENGFIRLILSASNKDINNVEMIRERIDLHIKKLVDAELKN